jgi:hypothetical protein
VAVAAGTTPLRAHALDNGLARTPYQGWNTFYGLGDRFDQTTIQSVADAMVSRGLSAAGYRYVWIDGGWWTGTRDASGNITVDAGRWPGGMKAVADYIHAKGLLAGITYALVATGNWARDSSIKSAGFAAVTARYLRLTATSAVNGYASAAEVAVSDIRAPEAASNREALTCSGVPGVVY